VSRLFEKSLLVFNDLREQQYFGVPIVLMMVVLIAFPSCAQDDNGCAPGTPLCPDCLTSRSLFSVTYGQNNISVSRLFWRLSYRLLSFLPVWANSPDAACRVGLLARFPTHSYPKSNGGQ
jgi:hypothetical protein